MNINDKIIIWSKWLDEFINKERSELLVYRYFYKTHGEIISESDKLTSHRSAFWDYLRDTYADSTALTIRRQLSYRGGETNNISITKILKAMESCTESDLEIIGLSRDQITQELNALDKVSKNIHQYVDKRLAHTDSEQSLIPHLRIFMTQLNY